MRIWGNLGIYQKSCSQYRAFCGKAEGRGRSSHCIPGHSYLQIMGSGISGSGFQIAPTQITLDHDDRDGKRAWNHGALYRCSGHFLSESCLQ